MEIFVQLAQVSASTVLHRGSLRHRSGMDPRVLRPSLRSCFDPRMTNCMVGSRQSSALVCGSHACSAPVTFSANNDVGDQRLPPLPSSSRAQHERSECVGRSYDGSMPEGKRDSGEAEELRRNDAAANGSPHNLRFAPVSGMTTSWLSPPITKVDVGSVELERRTEKWVPVFGIFRCSFKMLDRPLRVRMDARRSSRRHP